MRPNSAVNRDGSESIQRPPFVCRHWLASSTSSAAVECRRRPATTSFFSGGTHTHALMRTPVRGIEDFSARKVWTEKYRRIGHRRQLPCMPALVRSTYGERTGCCCCSTSTRRPWPDAPTRHTRSCTMDAMLIEGFRFSVQSPILSARFWLWLWGTKPNRTYCWCPYVRSDGASERLVGRVRERAH